MDARPSRRAMAHAAHAAGIFADMSVDGPAIGTLVIIVDRAKNLPNRKTMGKQNPYCAARLGKEARKTETDLRGGQTPRWDQELRFTVHESPDYFKLKVSVFNDDKKTDLIGETWVDLKDLIIPGGSQNDHWHPLQHRGKYAGEVRLEMTYYDTRPADEAVIERRTIGTEKSHTRKSITTASQFTLTAASTPSPSSSNLSGPRQLKDVKRRPLPTNPLPSNNNNPLPNNPPPNNPLPTKTTRTPLAQPASAVASHARPKHLHGHPEWAYETPDDIQKWNSSHAHDPTMNQTLRNTDYYHHVHEIPSQTTEVRPQSGHTNHSNMPPADYSRQNNPLIQQNIGITRQENPLSGSLNPVHSTIGNENTTITPPGNPPVPRPQGMESMRPQSNHSNYPFSSAEQYVGNISNPQLARDVPQAPQSMPSSPSTIMPMSSISSVPSQSSSSDGGSTVYPCSHKSPFSSEPSTVYPYPHNYQNTSSYNSGSSSSQPAARHLEYAPQNSSSGSESTSHTYPSTGSYLSDGSQSLDYGSEFYDGSDGSGPSMIYYGKSISEGGHPIPDYVWAAMQPRVEDEDDETSFPPPPPAHRVGLVHIRNIRPPSLVSSVSSGIPSVSSGLPSNYTTATTAVDSEMIVPVPSTNPLIGMQNMSPATSGPSVPPSLVAGLDPVLADAESDRVAYEIEARRRSCLIEENPLRMPPRDASPAPPYPLDTPPLDNHVNRSSISSSSDRQLVPRRKSVSPRPPSMRERGVSPTPFSPDSYDALNPNASRSAVLRDPAPPYETPSQAMEAAKRGDMDTTRDMGPIIGDDGREIDPSDHLPTDTWAPEPERKTKKPGVVVRFRNPPHRASPSTRPATDGTAERGFGIRRLPAYMDGASDMERTPRTTRREHSRGREEYRGHGHPKVYSTTSSSSHGRMTHRKSVSPAPSYSSPRMYAPANIGPPIPSKVPIAQAMNQSYPVLGGSMGMDALSRELNTIDIGSVGCSGGGGGGRSLKKYAPKSMGYAV
ncbi:uncharacterized protein BO97DRAFT_471778 [Aspergillus homomorphus CBS 101889]|uniref:C2 domain-containing protein n=1 Tax=Aspergillus homomorphus (strain CBS 101889) TaxID=1450537 RepID=A0A395HRU3_ASPHC|nr:hypothetical protein BO97DRAFT_471778 [Aspergillus homomorphus CBS 101889]RAL10276.1 hypothetical protein BO97DRAFT_471778 [Aspergillus homomorphus CBS 101889]